MEHLQAYNKKLLSNILPVHVADHFLNIDKNNDVSFTYKSGWMNIMVALVMEFKVRGYKIKDSFALKSIQRNFKYYFGLIMPTP